MKPEETIDFHIRWAWLKIAKMYNQKASNYGLTQSAGYILLNIDPKKGTPATQLGPMMGMEPTSLSRTLRSMEDKGWIEKSNDPNDKRVSRVCLTSEGSRLRSVSRKTVVGFNEKLLKEIGEKRFQQFKEVIQIIDQQTMN
ncbi:MarR family transcriptional regulator [Salibacteraceae bacterium]|nr:MarR family transcriptional regulator [Salibacteraceae bacterium]